MADVPTILVADDAPDILRLTRDYLEHAGFDVLTSADGRSALQTARMRHPDLNSSGPLRSGSTALNLRARE
jgi:DNA-binding response OmpR family regulator